MLFITHLLLGTLIGKLTGNYPVAIFVSLFPDLDHLWVYYKHKVLFSKKFFEIAFKEEDVLGEQRNIMHSLFFLLLLALVAWFAFPSIFLPLFFSYVGHILLDFIDRSESMPFYPIKYKTKGIMGFGSKTEFAFMGLLVLLVLIIK